jgi:hypothetical protein
LLRFDAYCAHPEQVRRRRARSAQRDKGVGITHGARWRAQDTAAGESFAEMHGDFAAGVGRWGQAHVPKRDAAEVHEHDAGRDLLDRDRRFVHEMHGSGGQMRRTGEKITVINETIRRGSVNMR